MLQRIKIKLKPLNNTILDYNYSYILSCELYNKLKLIDENYTLNYHKNGLRENKEDKNLKMLNPILKFKDVDMCEEGIIINRNDNVILDIGGYKKIITMIINGFMQDNLLKINNSQFAFDGFEYENLNKLKNHTLYKSFTPTIISVKENDKIKYIEIEDEIYIDLIKKNLLNKYRLLYKKDYTNELNIQITNIDNAKRKFVKIKNNIHVIGYKNFNIIIKADKEMQKIIYCCGIGINNMMGMGNLKMIRGDNIE